MAVPDDAGEPDVADDDGRDAAQDPLPRPMLVPTWSDVFDRLVRIDRGRLLGAGAVLLLVVGAAVAGYAVLRPPAVPATELLLPQAPVAEPAADGSAGATPGVGATTTTLATELVVHAAGAVAVPGVHRVRAGSRVADLLAAAGGPTGDTDLDRVNLAAALVDGERVWFPRLGEDEPPVVAGSAPAPGGPAGPGGVESAAPVDLNEATAEELDTLPGVGPATAAAILEHRERNGPFRTVEELLDVPGIGDAKLAQLRDRVTV